MTVNEMLRVMKIASELSPNSGDMEVVIMKNKKKRTTIPIVSTDIGGVAKDGRAVSYKDAEPSAKSENKIILFV